MKPLFDALDLIAAFTPDKVWEYTDLVSLEGRIAAESIGSPSFYPAKDKSLRDGIAFAADSDVTRPLIVCEHLAAEEKTGRVLKRGEAVRLSTGSYLPEGADTVVPVEKLSFDGDTVTVNTAVSRDKYIEKKGAVFNRGDRVLTEGAIIDMWHIETLASLRINNVRTLRLPRVGILSTGSEITWRFSSRRGEGIINSNFYAVSAFLSRLKIPHSYLGVAKDERKNLAAHLSSGINNFDALITFGGTAKGRYDLMESVVCEELGGKVIIDNVMVSPGRTFRFAQIGSTPVFILPGTPAAALICTELFFAVWLMAATGFEWRNALKNCRVDFNKEKKEGFHKIIPVLCALNNKGILTAQTRSRNGSPLRGQKSGLLIAGAELTSLAEGDLCQIFIPQDYF